MAFLLDFIVARPNFADISEPGITYTGNADTVIKSVEISNPTEDDADFEIVRIDTSNNEYMLLPGTIEAGNYAVFLQGLKISLPLGHKLIVRTENTSLLVVGNIVES